MACQQRQKRMAQKADNSLQPTQRRTTGTFACGLPRGEASRYYPDRTVTEKNKTGFIGILPH